MPNDEKLTTSIAARVAHVSEGTIRNMAKDGRLPSTKTAGGIRLFARSDVENVAASKK